MSAADLRALARALSGDVSGFQVLAPGPGHSPRDRSLCIKVEPGASGGLKIHSFAGDDWRTCKDYVRAKIGIAQLRPEPSRALPRQGNSTDTERTIRALDLWH